MNCNYVGISRDQKHLAGYIQLKVDPTTFKPIRGLIFRHTDGKDMEFFVSDDIGTDIGFMSYNKISDYTFRTEYPYFYDRVEKAFAVAILQGHKT